MIKDEVYMMNCIDSEGGINNKSWTYIKIGYSWVTGKIEELSKSTGWERKNGKFYR